MTRFGGFLGGFLIGAALGAGGPAPAAAQDAAPIPAERLVQIEDVDFFGNDLRSLFDVSLSACRAACLDDAECRAFTYNRGAFACFLKTGFSEMVAFEGAVSGRLVAAPDTALTRAETRAAELDFLPEGWLTEARDLAFEVGQRYPAEDLADQALELRARAAARQGDLYTAIALTGGAASLSDSVASWLMLADLISKVEGESYAQTVRLRREMSAAAVNAYLRSDSDNQRAAALIAIAAALEERGLGRRSITALRIAYDLDGLDATEQKLARAISMFGFHIEGHTVEADAASPRICIEFSEALVEAGVDYGDYVRLGQEGLPVEASGAQLCIDGVAHGERHEFTIREGLPAASGETLLRPATLEIYVRDRSPSVRFAGRGYVLPEGQEARIPIVTVNLDMVELDIYRVPERGLRNVIRDGMFESPLSRWDEERLSGRLGAPVWEGEGLVERRLNVDMTTTLPVGDAIAAFEPGVYVMVARAPTEGEDDYGGDDNATQWFVVTDIGLATMTGSDGLHVFARSLGSAGAAPGTELTLIAANNEVLGTATADETGYAVFAPGLTRGEGGMAPALLTAESGGDFTFLDLTGAGFDLSDRGVEGRPAPGPIDVFLTTERGIYRAGETVHATILARDATAEAITGLPLTAIVRRPDGVEFARILMPDEGAGGRAVSVPIDAGAMHGTWRMTVHADPEAEALASTAFLVEDFLPERIDFEMLLPEGPVSLEDRPEVALQADYLFGAPAGNLAIEGSVEIGAAGGLPDYPGYRFGPADAEVFRSTEWLSSEIVTDATGHVVFGLPLPAVENAQVPLEMTATVRVLDGSGRPVERQISRPVAPPELMIGIRPLFDGVAAEGAEARFDVIAIAPGGGRADIDRAVWELNRLTWDYQWYESNGSWRYEYITRRERIASGEVAIGTGDPARIAAPVEWGRYELRVTQASGDFTRASREFYAGWYAPAAGSDTPDVLEVGLDAERYTVGDTAVLRLKARDAGKVLVAVVDNRLIDSRIVDVPVGESTVEIPVTEAWGPGAYITATLVRPMDEAEGRSPARALGLAWATVDPGARDMSATFTSPSESDPRGPLETVLRIDGLAPGETAYATIAAVDVGILNMTGFEPPAPDDWYFGQRRLGMEMRDVYGRLIDPLQGVPGAIRSGGDDLASVNKAPPPTEKLVAFFSGVIEVGADGFARVSFDIPDFNGTVRLMAVTWSESGVGHASQDVLVRDPVVVAVSTPRFLAPGDESRALIELTHATGPAGEVAVELSASEGLTIPDDLRSQTFALAEGAQERLLIPVTAGGIGNPELTIAVVTPGGQRLEKTVAIGIRALDPEVARQSRISLSPGAELTIDANTLAGFLPGSGRVTLAAGPMATFDVPGLLSALNRYPYGCTEQVTSVAMPLLYFDEMAVAMGMESPAGVAEKIETAIRRVLANQSSTGGFGLWGPSSGDLWLDAYVTDFLSQARDAGYSVPDLAYTQALDNLRNQLAYAGEFDVGGQDIAYALMVLARQGLASIGDLRYYADAKAEALATPLAKAQLGAALAMYGESRRADQMFRLAGRQVHAERAEEIGYRYDYGTARRDAAAVLTLAALHGSNAIDREEMVRILTAPPARPGRRYLSSQEQAWTLMAAQAVLGDPTVTGISIDGAALDDLAVRSFDHRRVVTDPVVVGNGGLEPVDVVFTSYGVPTEPEPEGGNGYTIRRQYYTLEGDPVSPEAVAQNTRLVVILTVRDETGRQARLMVNDPLPAGFEIDNPRILQAGDLSGLDWLSGFDTISPDHAEFRAERFLAAVDWYGNDRSFSVSYVVRAVSPGRFHHPAALVEDMYRPDFRARTGTGTVEVLGPQR